MWADEFMNRCESCKGENSPGESFISRSLGDRNGGCFHIWINPTFPNPTVRYFHTSTSRSGIKQRPGKVPARHAGKLINLHISYIISPREAVGVCVLYNTTRQSHLLREVELEHSHRSEASRAPVSKSKSAWRQEESPAARGSDC